MKYYKYSKKEEKSKLVYYYYDIGGKTLVVRFPKHFPKVKGFAALLQEAVRNAVSKKMQE